MKYIDADKLIAEIERLRNQKKKQLEKFSDEDYCCSVASSINCELSGNLEVLSIIKYLQQEQPESKFVKVRCLFPFDKTWEKDKIYTCKVWHHGDLNRNFFDVYYDYEKDPKYVQFPTIELLNEEFAIIQEESKVIPEQQEADLEKFISDFLDKKDTENNGRWSEDDIVEAMTQAFELGLNARK